MIIDIHTHTFPERIAAGTIDKLSRTAHIRPFTDGTEKQLLASMEQAGVDLSVIIPVATAARQVEKVNDASARLNEVYHGKGLFSFGCMHPEYEGWHEELARIRDLGLKGIKLHPVYQGVDIDDIRFLRIIERAASLGLIVITHSGLDVGFPGVVHCSPKMCRHVVDEIGSFPFILAHMGGWRNWDEVPEYLAETGVYLDTAFSTEQISPLPDGYWNGKDLQMLDQDGFLKLVNAFTADRILFGTDCPWSSQTESIAFIRKLPVPEEAKEKILGGNAEKLCKSLQVFHC